MVQNNIIITEKISIFYLIERRISHDKHVKHDIVLIH